MTRAQHETEANKLLRVLLANDLTISECLSNYKFLLQEDAFMSDLRQAFKDKFAGIGRRLSTGADEQDIQKEINRCLCLLPLASIKGGSTYAIPTFVEEGNEQQWQTVIYEVSPIELSPTSGFGSLFIEEGDRLFAYGLTPLSLQQPKEGVTNLPRILIFSEPYPFQQGYLANLYMRFEFIRSYQAKINRWLANSGAGKNTIVYGMGGSDHFVLNTVCDSTVSQYIKKAVIIDAAGSRVSHLARHYSGKWNQIEQPPDLDIQNHHSSRVVSGWPIANNEESLKSRLYNFLAGDLFYGMINLFFMMPMQYLLMPLTRAIFQNQAAFIFLLFTSSILIAYPFITTSVPIVIPMLVFIATLFALNITFSLLQTSFLEKPPALCNKQEANEARKEKFGLFSKQLPLSQAPENGSNPEPNK